MLLEVRGVSKFYPGVKALKGVDFNIDAGEVVAVVGENGAGKSTLMKIIAGAIQPNQGELLVDNEPVSFSGPLEAQSRGICTIYQELMIVPELSVVENVFLGHLKERRGFLNWPVMRKEAQAILDRLGLTASLDAKAGDLSVAEQQLIEIAKSLSRKSRLLIMDEPTASLSKEEVANLFELVRSLKADGIAVVLITHHLHEIFEICDRLIVLRDGEYVGASNIKDIDEAGLVEMMLGHKVETEDDSRHRAAIGDEIVLHAKDLTRSPYLDNINLTLRRGEVLGIAGLMGAGRTELVRAIYGADLLDSGELSINGKLTYVGSPRAALDHGLGLAPEDRKIQGLVLSMSIGQNTTLPSLASHGGTLGINLAKENRAAEELCKRLFVKYADINHAVGTLSGGNQQKVVLAKLLGAGTDIYLLDEPTRGIDIGAKEAIFDLIWDLTAQGNSVIIISSVIEELIRVCDRIMCLHLGRVTQTYDRGDFDLSRIMLNAMGKTSEDIEAVQ
ncbi:sugar ABC transporter ATP-binding protein [Hoeflea poritis]|uniref:Sugar ABC transporter ATP-binding protein n=1 Tax=Hoeflea poritis TaxID=2993659 RepID=A0ABT4VMH4_9HYPH|nr:sugar ABC transporter ATP-binding protein [Hoeflea poritis]MDA4845876.1 sugar ABC transporter ATP-binding protein [Hoeflea poritis]